MSNAHHLLYNRTAWESHWATRSLRQNPSLIVPLDEDIHAILHSEVPVVPLLDHYTAMTVRREFSPDPHHHPLKVMDSLMKTIDTAIRSPKTKPIQRLLGELTIDAINMQRAYVSLGTER